MKTSEELFDALTTSDDALYKCIDEQIDDMIKHSSPDYNSEMIKNMDEAINKYRKLPPNVFNKHRDGILQSFISFHRRKL